MEGCMIDQPLATEKAPGEHTDQELSLFLRFPIGHILKQLRGGHAQRLRELHDAREERAGLNLPPCGADCGVL